MIGKQLLGESYFEDPSFYYVKWFTRIMIAGEFMLGVAVLQERHLKKIILPVMIGLLVAFILQIVYDVETNNKEYVGGNCGCFGDVIPFDYFETIIKNLVLIAMAATVYKLYKVNEEMNIPPVAIPYLVGGITLFTLALTIKKIEKSNEIVEIPFETDTTESVMQVDGSQQDSLRKDTILKSGTAMDTAKKNLNSKKPSIFDDYRNFTTSSGTIYKNLEEGTHLICLFSYTCGHCQETFKHILELKKKGGKCGNVYVIGYGSKFDEKNFWSMTGGTAPHITIDDSDEFSKIRQGSDFPKIIVKNNGFTKKVWDLESYSKDALFKYFGVTNVPDVDVDKQNDGIITPNGGGPSIIENPIKSEKKPWE
jgi:thiol-disulfide isomerase/thioredoxin